MPGTLDAAEAMLAEHACARLTVAYAHHVDLGDSASVADLFTEDGLVRMFGQETVGRENIRTLYDGLGGGGAVTRHVCCTTKVDLLDADHATGITYFTLFRGEPGEKGLVHSAAPAAVGEYRDRFARTADGWRIADRRVKVSFSA